MTGAVIEGEIIPPQKRQGRPQAGVSVVAARSPFRLERKGHTARHGQTVAQIIADLVADGHVGLEVWEFGEVRLGGHELPRNLWHRITPKPGRHMLEVSIRPRGGSKGGGGKNIFGTIAAIALLVVATAITGGAAAGLFGTTLFAAGSTSAALLAAGVSVVGALAINALAPTASPSSAAEDDSATATLGTADFSGNVIGQFEPIPFVLGRHRVAPPHVVPPWSESVNDDQYINAIVALNGAHQWEDIRVNGTPIDNLAGVEYETRDVVTDDSDLTVISNQVFETQVNAELAGHKVKDSDTDELQDDTAPANSYPQFASCRSKNSPDEIWLTLFWTGLINQDGGGTTPAGMGIRARIRRVGDTDWINLPEIHAVRERFEPFRGTVKIRFEAAPNSLTRPDQDLTRPPWKAALYLVNADTSEGEDTHAYFVASASKYASKTGIEDGVVVFYLDPATFPKGTYDVQMKRGYGYRSQDMNFTTYRLSSNVPYFFTHTAGSSPPSIRKEQSKVASRVNLASISSVWNEYPLREKGMALIAVRAKNVSISSLTAIATGYANVWNGTDWDDFRPTTNPAAQWRSLALGLQSIRTPLIEAQLDNAALIDWHEFCSSARSAVAFDGTSTHFARYEALTGIADSKSFTCSAWVYLDSAGEGALRWLWEDNASEANRIVILTDNRVELTAANAANTLILRSTSSEPLLLDAWNHILVSVDLAVPGRHHIFINDQDVSGTPATFTDDTIDWTRAGFAIGANFPSTAGTDYGARLYGGLGELWLQPGLYVDLSVEANRRAWISEYGRPENLGPAGEMPTGLSPLVYLSEDSSHSFESNRGTGGDFIYGRNIQAVGATFDGSNDYLTTGAGLTGAADSKLFTMSFWCRVDAYGGFSRVLCSATTVAGATIRARVEVDATSGVCVFMHNAAGAGICDIRSGPVPVGAWVHVLISIDLANAANRHIYVNDVAQIASAATYTNDTIDFTLADWAIGAGADGTQKWPGDLAEVWIAPGVYMDFSVEANRRKFRTAEGWPAYLGTGGTLPNGGTQPAIYLSGTDGDFATNQGAGGGFTVSGSLGTVNVEASGDLDVYELDEISGTGLAIRTCNAFISGRQSLSEVLQIVAACGRAASRLSDRIGVVIEKDRRAESPIALFGPRNSRGLTIRRAFPRVPDGLRVQFNDEDNDFQPGEVTVYRRGVEGGQEVESVRYVGITKRVDAISRAYLDLRQMLLRPALYNLDTDIENLYVTKGSLVALPHDTLRRHFDSARIVSASLSGGDLTGIEVDSPLRLDLAGDALAARFANDSYTRLLLHFDGENGSTTFTDVSTAPKTFTASGDAHIDTGSRKFGTASGYFNGSGSHVTAPDSDDFNLGSSDFEIECWFNCSAPSGETRRLAGQRADATAANTSFRIERQSSGVISAGVGVGATLPQVATTSLFTNTDNTGWHHLLFARSGGTLLIFVDGVLENTAAISGSVNAVAAAFGIGSQGGLATDTWLGNVDEFRMRIGIADRTSDFSLPTAAYADPPAPSYLTRGAGLTGASDANELTYSAWLYIDPNQTEIAASPRLISGATSLGGSTERLAIHLSSFGLHFVGLDASGVTLLDITVAEIDEYVGKWVHVLASFDLANPASRHVYLDDVAAALSVGTFTSGDVDFTLGDWGVGSFPNGGSRYSGSMAEVWFAPGVYLDLSVEANRRKFISPNGRPVSLGATGNTPTGSAPLLYLSANDGNFADNEGDGGDFTLNGALADDAVFYADGGFPAGVVLQLKDGSTMTAAVDEETETASLTFADPQPLPAYLTDQGAWATSTAYEVDDVVSHGGAAYSCLAAHTSGSSTEPDAGTDWPDYWEPLLADCLVAAGPFQTVEKRMIALAIKPSSDLQASLTLVDEAPPVAIVHTSTPGAAPDRILVPGGGELLAPL